MQHCDAQDLVQQVLLSVASAIEHYENNNDGARFRNWLSRITRNAILKSLSRGPSDRAVGGSEIVSLIGELPAANSDTDALIELEYQREGYHRAAARVRREVQEPTWLAFELTVLQEQSAEQALSRSGTFHRQCLSRAQSHHPAPARCGSRARRADRNRKTCYSDKIAQRTS